MVMESAKSTFLFSVQRALPNELSPALAGVAIDTDEKTLYVRCYFQAPVGEPEREFLAYLQDAVWADFFPTIRVDVQALDASLMGATPTQEWVYRADRSPVTV